MQRLAYCWCIIAMVVLVGACEEGPGGKERENSKPINRGPPDLVVTSPSVSDSSPAVGATFTLSATVRNDGDGAAAASTLRFYRSPDAAITTANTEMGTNSVAELATSETSSESVDLTAPSSPGTYFYGACVDAVADESNTTNNCSASVRVAVVEPQECLPLQNRTHPTASTFRDCDVCPEMVKVPAGSFLMGEPDPEWSRSQERPVHEVTIGEPFAAGVYELTFAEWDACLVDGGCGGHYPDDRGWGRCWRPVVDVSWEDAQSYVSVDIAKNGTGVPVAERGGVGIRSTSGDDDALPYGGETITTDEANFRGAIDRRQTLPVGSFEPNAFGLYDVHGNVYEWVQDCWNDSYEGAPLDGSAWESGSCHMRLKRGGSWTQRAWRSALRDPDSAKYGDSDKGFRVARTLAPEQPREPPQCLPDCAGANLTGADLRGVDLHEANLARANLTRANLSRANLIDANLSGTVLSAATVKFADLSNANLSYANLVKANLSYANLTGVNLHRAVLDGATLTGVVGCDVTGRLPDCS